MTTALATHPLLAQLPTTGYIVQFAAVGPGVVIVEATPDSGYGAYQVTGYRPLTTWEIESQQADFPGETGLPTVDFVTAAILQGTEGIDAEIATAVAALTARLSQCELCGALADASGYRVPEHDPRCPTHDPRF